MRSLVRLAASMLALLACSPALAHGEEIVALPLGFLVAVPLVGTLAWGMRKARFAAPVVVLSALTAAIVLLLIPDPFYLVGLPYLRSAVGYFLVGLLPLAVSAMVAIAFRISTKRERAA